MYEIPWVEMLVYRACNFGPGVSQVSVLGNPYPPHTHTHTHQQTPTHIHTSRHTHPPTPTPMHTQSCSGTDDTHTCVGDPREDPALSVGHGRPIGLVVLLQDVHAAAPRRGARPVAVVPAPVPDQNAVVVLRVDLGEGEETGSEVTKPSDVTKGWMDEDGG